MSQPTDAVISPAPVQFSSLADTPEQTLDQYREMPYQEFLRTTYWVTITAHVIAASGKCQLCSASSNLAVHHNTYENHGREHLHLADLTVLCGRCHTYFHRTKQLGDGVPLLYRSASTDNFRIPTDNPAARARLGSVLMRVKSWLREYPVHDVPGLLFMGAPGTGKTHLAVSTLHGLARRGLCGLFYDYQDLAERLGVGMRDGSSIAELDACRNAEVLLLDDIGSQRHKDWMEDAVLSIIKHRCNHRKPLIATTSLPDEWAGPVPPVMGASSYVYQQTLADLVGAKARSRLFEMCRVIDMSGVPDFRLKEREVPQSDSGGGPRTSQ